MRYALFLLCLLHRYSIMSAVFIFNASHNGATPVSPIFVPVYKAKKRGLLMDNIYVLFLLYSLLKLSSVSVVFDFNASLIDVAPASPMLFTVC